MHAENKPKRQMLTNIPIKTDDGLRVFQVDLVLYDGLPHPTWKAVEKALGEKFSEIRDYCKENCTGIWGYARPRSYSVYAENKIKIMGSCLFVAYDECDILAIQMMYDVKVRPQPMWRTSTLFTIIYTGDQHD